MSTPTPALMPYLWNAPFKPYHLKPVSAYHHSFLTNHEAYSALPKQKQKRQMQVCMKCSKLVVWLESKSGSMFLCDAEPKRRRNSWDFYYYPSSWHSKTCQPTEEEDGVHPKAWEYKRQMEFLHQEHQKVIDKYSNKGDK